MVKTLIILVLLFNGTLVKERYNLTKPMEVHECLMFADNYLEVISKHSWDDPRGQGWYLNEGRCTVQGFICD